MQALKYTLGLVLLAEIAAGCDNISEEDRYIKVEKPVIENAQTLLIMEFTGNNCKNCPEGANIITEIKEDEGPDKVISVGLHPYGDINTEPVPSKYAPDRIQDFRTDAATALYNYYKPSGFPSAIFNGLNMSGSMLDWAQRASEALTATARMSISASCEYDSESQDLTVNYTVEFGNTISDKLNLTVWLVENHIKGTQMMPDGKMNREYEHNHVLRASLNGDWGQTIANENGGSVDSESAPVTGAATISFKDTNWVPENCEAVVFVYRDSDKGVEQAAKAPVLEELPTANH